MAPGPPKVDNGVGASPNISWSHALIVCSFSTIAWYNVAELIVLIYTFFKRHSGVYFWSMIVATAGIFTHVLGDFLKFFRLTRSHVLYTCLGTFGWMAMVTGQSIVLWSRLHLVVHATWTRLILIAIIADGVILHVSTGVLTFLTNLSADPTPYEGPYSVVEKIQVTIFFLQEAFLGCLYIWKTMQMLLAEGSLFDSQSHARGERGRKVLLHTIVTNVFIICMEIVILVLEFAGLYAIQTPYKSAVYSIKLKLEFTILNQLMNLVRGNLSANTNSHFNSTPRSANRPGIRSIVKSTKNKDMGNSTGVFTRMDEPPHDMARNSIPMHEIRDKNVLKTTTTEVTFERMEGSESVVSGGSDPKGLRRSSSEIHIVKDIGQ